MPQEEQQYGMAWLLAHHFKSVCPILQLNFKAGLLENALTESDLVCKYLIFHSGFPITQEASRSHVLANF